MAAVFLHYGVNGVWYFDIEIMEGFFFSFFLWFGLVKCFVIIVYWQERRMVICHRIAIEVVFFRSEGLLWCQWYKLSSEGK